MVLVCGPVVAGARPHGAPPPIVSASTQQIDLQSRRNSRQGIRGFVKAEGAPKIRFLGVTSVPRQKNARTSSHSRASVLSENEGDI